MEATPGAYNELSRAQVLTGKCWTSPTLAHRKLYLRNQEEIVCLDLHLHLQNINEPVGLS